MTVSTHDSKTDLDRHLARLKSAVQKQDTPNATQRIDWIDRALNLLVTHQDSLCEAMREDFGHRSKDQSALTDIAASIAGLKYAKRHLKGWMQAEKRRSEFPLGLLGARSEVRYQPKGVVGIVAPWNVPVGMVFSPLASVFAAGNRVMVKPSEFTEHTSELLKSLFAQYYSEDEAVVVTGGPDVGAAFTSLPFDHIIFTGSTSIARHVMRAAAENLVPVTLELGGKSPVILGKNANMKKAATRIMNGKAMNAGQVCLAPDYILVPEDQRDEFVAAATEAVERMFPSGLRDNQDYTSVLNQRHHDRLADYLKDARDKGADVIELNPKDEDFSQQQFNKMPPHLVLNPTDEMTVMQDELFGPILPVKTYSQIGEALDYINEHPHPLAMYYFGDDAQEIDRVINSTMSGGVSINDVIFHVAQEDLPFGGVGPSGMGAYHGKEGFEEFSHKRAVFKQTGSEMIAMLRPPFGNKFRKQMSSQIKL